MKNITYLLHGNHPKAGKLKLRTAQIIKIIKQNGGKIEAKELEIAIGINRIEDPSLFYKPLAALRKWDLVQSHKKVIFDDVGKKHFVTTYELTPELFYHRLQKTLVETCRTELEMLWETAHFVNKAKRLNEKICPNCSGMIFPFIGFGAGMIYDCKKCGYHGPLALMKTKKPAKLK